MNKGKIQNLIRQGLLFDHLASEGWEYSKEDLITISKELAYAIDEAYANGETKARELAASGIEEYAL